MSRFADAHVFSVIAISTGIALTLNAVPQQSSDEDDRAVILGSLEHTIRPWVIEANGSATPVPPLFVFSRTSALCKSALEDQPLCIRLDEVKIVLDGGTPAFARPLDKAISHSIARELVESFKDRNQSSYTLPQLNAPGVVMVTPTTAMELFRWGHEPARGYSTFSRPAYSKEGFALVHGVYHCGPLCGNSHLFVLQKTASGWQVAAVALLSIA